MEARDDIMAVYLDDLDDRRYTGFADYYEECINKQGLGKSELIKRCRIERTYVYQILKGIRNPGREKIIIMCIAAGFSFTQTQKALVIAKEGILYYRDDRDSILIYAITHGFNLVDTNTLLEKNGFEDLN